jgi:hypothetical protein
MGDVINVEELALIINKMLQINVDVMKRILDASKKLFLVCYADFIPVS